MNLSSLFSRRIQSHCPRFGKALPFIAVFFGLFFSLPAHSQTLGRISGVVTDASGGAISGATVTVTDVARGTVRTVTTDNSGSYVAPDLIQGTYTVHATYQGFQAFDRQDIVIGVAGDVHVDVKLQPGSQTQTITVTGEIPAITTTNAQLQGTISGQDLSDLPFSGHNYVQLLGLLPTLQLRPGSGAGPTQNNSNGLRGEYNVYVLDGVSDQMAYYTTSAINGGQPAGGSEQAVMLPTDAIQEFNVVENSKAEFGWRPGAQLDVAIKSGANAIHGTGFALGRDTALMARNPFFGSPTPTAFENFGGTFGGAVKKDKLFYFVGYEGQRYDVGNPKTVDVPTTAPGLGAANSLPDAINGLLNHSPSITPSALSLALAGCVIVPAVQCTPGKGLFSNGTSSTAFPVDFPSVGRTDNGVARVDYSLNEHNSLSGEFFDGDGPTLEPVSNVTQQYWSTPLEVRTSVARAWWTWIPSSTWVNDFRFGWDNSRSTNSPSYDCTAASGAPNYASLGFIGGGLTCGFPTITISGFTEGTGTNVLGGETGTNETSGLWRWVDTVSYTHGNHIFKFGAEFVYSRLSISLNTDQEKGTINFNSTNPAFTTPLASTALENFMAGDVGSATLLTGTLPRQYNYPAFAFFGQDDWRILPRVTLNLGLRYEYTAPISEANGQVGNINLNTTAGIVQANGGSLYKLDPWAFAPRFGLAWDVTGKGKTVVRTGFNIIYQNPTVNPFITPGASLNTIPTGLNLENGATTVTVPGGTINLHSLSIAGTSVPWAVNTPVFSNFVGTNSACTNIAPCAIGGVTSHLEYPMVLNWNVGVQHAITNNLTIDASYVGNHGQHLFDYIDINQPNPFVPTTASTAGITSPGANSSKENALRPYDAEYPWFSMLRMLGAISNRSNYNALQVTLRERASHGLTFLAAYTYSHALDTNSSDLAMLPPENAHNPGAEYGNSNFDIRHRFTFGPSYLLPGKSGYAQMLQGWQVTSTVSIFSGRPINPTDAADDLSETGEAQDRWTLVGPATDFKFGKTTPIPCYDADLTSGSITTSGTWVGACKAGLPQACITAATNEPNGPGGSIGTGLQELDRLGCYMMGGAVIVPPALGTFGSMSRNDIYGVGFWEWDMSLIKSWKIKERITTQFRAEFYNLTNTTQYYTPNAVLSSPSNFGESTATPDVGVNSPIVGTGGPRKIQFGLKFIF